MDFDRELDPHEIMRVPRTITFASVSIGVFIQENSAHGNVAGFDQIKTLCYVRLTAVRLTADCLPPDASLQGCL